MTCSRRCTTAITGAATLALTAQLVMAAVEPAPPTSKDAPAPQGGVAGGPTVFLATGDDSAVDGYYETNVDTYGSWASTGFTGGGDGFNPMGDPTLQEVAFTDGLYVFIPATMERELLSDNEGWQTSDFPASGPFADDTTLDRMITSALVTSDTNADSIDDTATSSFRVFGATTDLGFDLTQHVEQLGPGLSLIQQDYVITNDGPDPVSLVLTRVLDADLLWDAEANFADDEVGTFSNTADQSWATQREESLPADTAVTLQIEAGPVKLGAPNDYYGSKNGEEPPMGTPALTFGTNGEIFNAFGAPESWVDYVANVGYDTDGFSTAFPPDADPAQPDGSVGAQTQLDLASGESATVTVYHFFGANWPFGQGCPGVGDCLEANGTPGCDEEECCNLVCDMMPECCSIEWDMLCAAEAAVLCATPECCTGEEIPEPEPCGDDTNGGCATGQFTTINCNETICGTIFATTVDGVDRDWYRLDLDAEVDVTATLESQFPGSVFFFELALDPCSTTVIPGQGISAEPCEAGSVTQTIGPGSFAILVNPGVFEGLPCDGDSQYRLSVECPPGACCFLDGTCSEEPNEAACIDAGGDWQGQGTVCDPNPCPIICGNPEGGDCCAEHMGIGCNDTRCCLIVCESDPACCEIAWDGDCAMMANEVCAVCNCPVSTVDPCEITQNIDAETIEGTVACATPEGNTTPNGWARCYNLVEEGFPVGEDVTLASVTFGVSVATTDGIEVNVNVYLDEDGCPPENPTDDPLLASASTTIDMADVDTFVTVDLPADTTIPAGTDFIVEIEQPADGTVEPLFGFRPAANEAQACGASYLRAAACGIPGWVDFEAIGFTSQIIQILNCDEQCIGDTNNDGTVDVTDIVNVISDWNTDGSGNNGDVNNDGIVNVQDLTELILNWGPC